MKKFIIKTAVASLFGLAASQSMAAFVTLPTSGTSAYVQCRVTGNFGSVGDTTYPSGTDTACVAPNGIGVGLPINNTPETGYTFAASQTSSVSAFSETVATLNERVFRDTGAGMCIYAKQLVMSASTTHDYNPSLPGTQKMEVNDYAFGGYSGAVSIAYAKIAANHSSAFRGGRAYTSVQMQADGSNPGLVAAGYLVLPTAGGLAVEINGVGQTLSPPGTPVPSQQEAPFSLNWVDFTTDVTAGIDEDGTTNPASPTMYIKQACSSATTSLVANSLKLRQTGQETQPWVTITGSSNAPGTNITP